MAERINPPLRHGWGGDKKRRNRILQERREEALEREKFPYKYADISLPPDMGLLEKMQEKT